MKLFLQKNILLWQLQKRYVKIIKNHFILFFFMKFYFHVLMKILFDVNKNTFIERYNIFKNLFLYSFLYHNDS